MSAQKKRKIVIKVRLEKKEEYFMLRYKFKFRVNVRR